MLGCNLRYQHEFMTFFFSFLAALGFELRIQVLTLANQVLYHLNHSTSTFLGWVFSR
jgi:hypothetical protein